LYPNAPCPQAISKKGGLMEGWAVVNVEVVIAYQDTVVELKGKAPSRGYDIYLSYILVEPIR